MEILKLLVRVMTFLFIMSGIPSCSQGWSISGIELTPSDSTNKTVFLKIVDVDSIEHWYHGSISDFNWCYKHEEYEEVVVK